MPLVCKKAITQKELQENPATKDNWTAVVNKSVIFTFVLSLQHEQCVHHQKKIIIHVWLLHLKLKLDAPGLEANFCSGQTM